MKTYYKFRTQYRPTGIVVDEDACAFHKFVNATKLVSFAFSHLKNLPIHYLNSVCPLIVSENKT